MMLRTALVLCITVAPALSAADDLEFRVTDAEGGMPLSGAVIVLPLPADGTDVTASMVQENRQFVPHVLVVPPGTDVAFPNRDNTQHHVYSFSPARPFEIELYAGVPEAPVHFGNTGVVELGCNIHDTMQGFILVTDQRHGVTDDQGRLSLEWPTGTPPPPQVRAWHPRLDNNSQLVSVTIDGTANEPTHLALGVRPEPDTDDSLQRLQQRFREL